MNTEFSVGYDGKIDYLKRIIDSSGKVKSIYTGGLIKKIGGGRPQYLDSWVELEKQIKYAHSKGISFELALNAPCGFRNLSDKKWWRDIKKYIKDLEKVGVDSIILSHPFLMDLVKSHTRMKITVSTICEIMNARAALYYEKLGGDIITPSININMDIKALRLIKASLTKASLRIILNEHCLGDCPWRRFHHNHYSHSNYEIDYHFNCKREFLNNPFFLLTNTVIRPEDLHYYKGITGDFKIIGRLVPIDDLLLRIRAYAKERFSGNFVRLFEAKLSSIFYIPNKLLDGLILKKWACSKICNKCNFCKRLFNRIGKRIKE
jgi:collagenase-like PrtC family protease